MRERDAGEVMRGLAGEYVIRRKHGEGGFGVTYDANVRSTGERVIVKELRFERLREWKALELFEREGEVLAEISHPAVPAYRDFFALAGERPFPARELTSYAGEEALSVALVQTFVEGPTLAARVENEGPLTGEEVERVLRRLLDLLSYLHGLNPPVIHRDINPKNLLLRSDGQVSLVDFGAIQDRLRAASSGGSTTVGTLGYMPLEQLRGDARPASDLYALGVTMLVAASGKSPSDLAVDEETGKLQVSQIGARWSPRLRRAIDAMIEPIVGHRAASARRVLAILDEKGATSRPSGARSGSAPGPGAPSRIGLIVVAGSAVAIVGGVVGLLVFARAKPAPRSEPRPPPAIVTAASVPRSIDPGPSRPTVAAPPPAASAPPVQLTWKAQVTGATGLHLGSGATCKIEAAATPRSGKEPDVDHTRITCGTQVLYDQDTPLNGISMWSAGLRETPAPGKTSTFREALVYSDKGERSGKSQAAIDTTQSQALVFSDDIPTFRVTLSVEPFTQREGSPLFPPD
jgi:serine/threonine protein kinase